MEMGGVFFARVRAIIEGSLRRWLARERVSALNEQKRERQLKEQEVELAEAIKEHFGHVVAVNIEDEIRESYMAYAMSVIVGRALPDVRDGLKPVHRRILYAMYEMGNTYNRAYKKSARVVGNVIGKFHPHGDSSVYDALVRLAQDFNMRVPLIDGQGNFGSVDGDPPAAMRYTEVRMTRACGELLGDLDRDTVGFQPNYDEAEEEPTVLPTKIPNLLVNGSGGIAVGMATNIPPHNLGEVMEAVIALIRDPRLSLEELIRMVPGPDFPTAGVIHGRQGIWDAYRTGRGVIRIRARTHVEELANGKPQIIVTELPYQVNKARLLEKIAGLVKEKKLEGITNLRDESDRRGMRMVIELRRDMIPEIVLNQLYKQTALQSSFGVIMLAIVAGQPQVLTLREVMEHFIEFRRDVTIRRSVHDLRKARDRLHILEGLKVAVDNTDEVIRLVRGSGEGKEAVGILMGRFGLSQVQAQAILEMRLQRLTGIERGKLEDEAKDVGGVMGRMNEILGSRSVLDQVIIEDLQKVKDAFTTPRLTEIVEDVGSIGIEDLIAVEDMVVTRTHGNYIKRVALSEYRAQRRGTQGKMGMKTKESDFVEDLFVASTHTPLFIFTTTGRAFQLKVYQLPEGDRTARGKPIIHLLSKMAEGEGIAAVLPVPESDDEVRYLMTVTRNGVVKKTALAEYRNINASGLRAVNIREDDQLVKVRLISPQQTILLATRKGASIRFNEDDVRAVGRSATGVRGIRLGAQDEVIDAVVVESEQEMQFLTITSRGYGKRTAVEEYRLQNRGGKGILTIKPTTRNGEVIGVLLVDADYQLLLVTDRGTLLRTSVAPIRQSDRNTKGVRIIQLRDEERLVAVARVVEEDDEDEVIEVVAVPEDADEDPEDMEEGDAAGEALDEEVEVEEVEAEAEEVVAQPAYQDNPPRSVKRRGRAAVAAEPQQEAETAPAAPTPAAEGAPEATPKRRGRPRKEG